MALEAISIAPSVCAWLGCSSAARVLHVFDRACNLINSDGAILSLVTAELGPGPFAIVISLPQPHTFAQLITSDSPVTIEGDTLTLGPLAIHTAGAPVWPPRPPWKCLRRQPAALLACLPAINAPLANCTPIGTNLAPAGGHWPVLSIAEVSAAATLLHGLAANDADACRDGARGLAGLGPGLTPAGDDYLMGVIYALWATRPADEARLLADVMAATAVPRTTSLSAAWLAAAARGQAGAPWHDLVEGMVGEDETAVTVAINRILHTGHTSGADALAGFTAVLAAHP